jgi:transcriptional regulator with XRE-family HTH domain
MTNEARALRELRIARGLSMRKAGELIGVTDSYISHIENGRVDFPSGERLEKILTAYGGMKIKSFYEKARNWRERITAKDELVELICKMNDEKIKFLLGLAKNL